MNNILTWWNKYLVLYFYSISFSKYKIQKTRVLQKKIGKKNTSIILKFK